MKIFQIAFICTTIFSTARCAKSEDEGRPYEFGFTVDGQQHRYEKKGVNGIIQGEFGFITADGIYHVTTYATDENGAFRILSMRNVRISDPLDGSGGTYSNKVPASEVQKGGNIQKPVTNVQKPITNVQSQPLQASTSPTTTIRPTSAPILQSTTSRVPHVFTTQPTIKPACAGCGYVTRPPPTQKPVVQTLPNIASNEVNQAAGIAQQQVPNQPQMFPPSLPHRPSQVITGLGQTQPSLPDRPQAAIPPHVQTQPASPSGPPQPPSIDIEPPAFNEDYNKPQVQPISQNSPVLPPNVNQINQNVEVFRPGSASTPTIQNEGLQLPVNTFARPPVNNEPDLNIKSPDIVNKFSSGDNVKTPPFTNNQLEANKPSLADRIKIEDGKILVPNNPPIKIQDKYPGMVDGLPKGIEEKDISNLLYKFNYTIGFHGHYERGLKNGTKIGGYFVNGRDGYSRIVTYVADELGYRPSFRLINLGLDSPLTPKEDTEKTFGLKNFEFVWFPLN